MFELVAFTVVLVAVPFIMLELESRAWRTTAQEVLQVLDDAARQCATIRPR